MPKRISQNELDLIIETLLVSLGGISWRDFGSSYFPRNVQNRLVFLVKNGQLHAPGRAGGDYIGCLWSQSRFLRKKERTILFPRPRFLKKFKGR